MAVTDRQTPPPAENEVSKPALQALTAAAMLLPGLMNLAQAGEGDEFSFQYGHYQEGERNTYLGAAAPGVIPNGVSSVPEIVDVPQSFKPIEVDSISANIRLSLTDRLKFNVNYSQDTWSGATPIATAPAIFNGNDPIFDEETGEIIIGASPQLGSQLLPTFDSELNPLTTGTVQTFIPFSFKEIQEIRPELTHILVSASPETRKQIDLQLNYEWDEAALDIGGGVSLEKDYESHFFNLGGRWDFNQKLTSVSLGGSYTGSAIKAVIQPEARQYIRTVAYDHLIRDEAVEDAENKLINTHQILSAERKDWGVNLGLSQVLYKDGVINTSFGYTHSSGFLENPYKTTLIYRLRSGPDNTFRANPTAYIEQRPDLRRKFTWDLGYVQYINPLDASLHLDYQLYLDDWGINAHAFAAEWVQPLGFGFTLAPRVRYYSQTAADFYTPFLTVLPPTGSTIDNLELAPDHFSSDHRLSAFGTLSYGITLSKEFAKGVKLEGSYEYYMHRGSLVLSGEGEGDYADFDYWAFNAGLTVSLSALSSGGSSDLDEHAEHYRHGSHAPAGVMFAHMLDEADQFMVGYRYKHSRRIGQVLNGTRDVTDQEIHNKACPGEPFGCRVKPSEMDVTIHTLNLMYAPTDWMNLMLMPQFITKSMNMHSLEGVSLSPNSGDFDQDEPLLRATQHAGHQHESGALGDIGMFVLFKLIDFPQHRLHISFGATAPTGDVDLSLGRVHQIEVGFNHYAMQPGSGTWDLKPGVTYTGNADDFFWGAQVTGTYRMGLNESGFAFGNNLQATAWGGYQLFNWLSATVRGVYSIDGELKGEYPEGTHIPIGPMDQPENYGGKYWDIGLGLQASVPSGDLAGNTLSVEYLQPLVDDVNGYQLEREGSLVFNWSYVF